MAEEYSFELQILYLEFLTSDHDLFVRCNSILDPEFFDRKLRPAVTFIQQYVNDYGKVPELKQIKATTGIELDDIKQSSKDHRSWFLDNFEQFCRHKALAIAILASTDKLENQEYGAVESLIKDAVSIGLAKELGINYWENPEERIQRILDKKGDNSTGWKTIDKVLYGGFARGELSIFAGSSGSGKSVFLQNLALNWAELGLNVIYISLELSAELCSMRIDSMISGFSSLDIFKNRSDTALKVKMKSRKCGALQVVQLANGIDVNDIKAYIKEYQIQNNIQVDCLIVDYLDLMMPAKVKISADNVFQKDKHICEELRNVAVEGDYLLATASQLGRSSVDEVEFNHAHIAGGISKINTADTVIGILNSMSMRERGRIQVQFMKTRNSGGTGKKVDLEYNINSLRILDLDEDAEDSETLTTNSLYKKMQNNSSNQISSNSSVIDNDDVDIDQAINNADKLKSILKRIN